MKLDYLDSNNGLLFSGGVLWASHLIILHLGFEQNSTRHSKLYLTVRYCVNGYCWGLCIHSFINTFILTSEAILLYQIVSGSIITFYLILASSGRAAVVSHSILSGLVAFHPLGGFHQGSVC